MTDEIVYYCQGIVSSQSDNMLNILHIILFNFCNDLERIYYYTGVKIKIRRLKET